MRRCVAAVIAIVALAVGWSFARAVVVSNGDPFSANATEWLRNNHLGWLVDRVENLWYSHHQPPIGGMPRGGIPTVDVAAPASTPPVPHRTNVTPATATRSVCPTAIVPIAAQALHGEGAWQPVGRAPGEVCFAYLRPDAVHTSVVVGVAWMNMAALRATLHNGTLVPGGGPWRAGPEIAPADYGRVVAAFNGGFRLDASRGGYVTEGRVVRPLVAGRASLMIFADGRVDVGMWGRDDTTRSATIVSVRQNLDLLVDGGLVVPSTTDANSRAWGATLGNAIYTWRSGVGVDRHGNLVYVGGNGLNVATLAAVLADAGCVRAMELDINPEWVSLMAYAKGAGATPAPTKLLESMQRPADRYLHPGTRDFIELDAR